MRGFPVTALLALSLLGTTEAAQHRSRLYPNPAVTIFSIVQGADGLLWLAAKDGLYRFDGFHYQKVKDYPFQSARVLAATPDDSIWAGDYEGLVRFQGGKFEKVLTEPVITMAGLPDKLFVRTTGFDFKEIQRDGSIRQFPFPVRRDLSQDAMGRLWGICVRPEAACWIDPNHTGELHKVTVPDGYQTAASDSMGNLWVATDTVADMLQSGHSAKSFRRNSSRETSRAGPLLSGRNGQLWFLGEAIQGLSSPVRFEDRADTERYSILTGYEDSRGHLWTARAGYGLAEWSPDPDWQRWFAKDFSGEVLDFVVHDQRGDPILATHKNLYRLNAATQKWSAQFKEERQYDGLLPFDNGGYIASIRGKGVVRLSPDGKVVEQLRDRGPRTEPRKILRDRSGRIWVATKRILMSVEGSSGSLHLQEWHLPGAGPGDAEDAVDLDVDESGRLWVGYDFGIAWLDEKNQWHQIPTDRPVRSVRSFAAGKDDIWVSHRRSGSFSRLHRKGERWIVTELSTRLGYNPADTEFMKRDSRGWIWRGTPEGVYVSDGRRFAPEDWLHIDVGNGLASDDGNQYGFLENADGTVWLVGEQGLTLVRPDVSWFAAPTGPRGPQITRVEADGQPLQVSEGQRLTLPPDTKVLQIDIGTLAAPPFRDPSLRYRLLPAVKDWQLSADGTLEWHDLPMNLYTLEVGYSGDGPSAVVSYSIAIGDFAPLSKRSWPAWYLIAGILALTVALVPLLRLTPALEGPRFQIEKGLFLLRRRFSRGRLQSSDIQTDGASNYCGKTLLGRYVLGRIVSRGGFSVVYEARKTDDDDARCAVKVLTRSSSAAGWVRDRFAHEVAALRSLHHPNVVPILDSWIAPAGEPCIAMPFLDGPTLRAVLDGPPLASSRVARILERLGDGLALVHAHGIVHRDIKPENLILLNPGADREDPVIIDFGTAGLRSAENELAATRLMAGSFHYMAPERLTGHYSPASDVFSLAVVLLEMLTGKRLSDVGAIYSDPSFSGELEGLLAKSHGPAVRMGLVPLLISGFDPEPRRRPSDVRRWTAEIGTLLQRL